MFERFNPSARNVVVQSQREARALQHSEVGSAHLLLGVLAQPGESVTTVLESHRAGLDAVREYVREIGKAADPGRDAARVLTAFGVDIDALTRDITTSPE